jgi:hypothetical protein
MAIGSEKLVKAFLTTILKNPLDIENIKKIQKGPFLT